MDIINLFEENAYNKDTHKMHGILICYCSVLDQSWHFALTNMSVCCQLKTDDEISGDEAR